MATFNNKRALVTGGGSGIGLACAREVISGGGRVLIVGRRQEVLEKARDELGEAADIKVCDVTDGEAVEAAVDYAVDRMGGLDLAVNAAGMGWAGSVANMPADEFVAVIETNLTGVFRSMSAEARVMKKAVAYLTPFMEAEKQEGEEDLANTMVIATVKAWV